VMEAGESGKSEAFAALSVAPVVMTSSTSMTCCPVSFCVADFWFLIENASHTLVSRCSRESDV